MPGPDSIAVHEGVENRHQLVAPLSQDRRVDERLRRRAERQGGVFSWTDLRACALGEHDVRAAIRADEVVRVRRDAFVLAERWRGGWPAEQLALRTRAVLLARPRDAASHQSALVLHGVATWGLPTDVVDLMGRVRRTRLVNGVRTHPRDCAIDLSKAGGCAVVAVATAIVQVTLRHGVDAGVVSLDHALHEHRFDVSKVRSAAGQLAAGPRDRARVKALMTRADPLSESVGETRTRLLLEDLGYEVRSQVAVRDGDGRFVARVDFMIGAVIVEFDGMVKYEGADGRAALAREKAREERLTALGGVVIRLVWSDLDHPERVQTRVERALARVARRL